MHCLMTSSILIRLTFLLSQFLGWEIFNKLHKFSSIAKQTISLIKWFNSYFKVAKLNFNHQTITSVSKNSFSFTRITHLILNYKSNSILIHYLLTRLSQIFTDCDIRKKAQLIIQDFLKLALN